MYKNKAFSDIYACAHGNKTSNVAIVYHHVTFPIGYVQWQHFLSVAKSLSTTLVEKPKFFIDSA